MAVEIPGPKTGYTDLLDQAITGKLKEDRDKQVKGEEKPWFPLRPSSAGHCARKLAYELNEYRGNKYYKKELLQPEIYRLFNLGHSIEYNCIRNLDLIKDLKILYKQQSVTLFKLKKIPGVDEEIVEGSCDGVFEREGQKVIFDVKSVKDKYSKAYKSSWDEKLAFLSECNSVTTISDTSFYIHDMPGFLIEIGDDWLRDNIVQLNAYGSSSFFKERNVVACSLFRYNKNDSRHMEIRWAPNEKMFLALEKKYNLINHAISKKRPDLVPRPYTLGSMRCAFCNFASECWGDKDSLKEWFKTFPEKKWPIDTNRLKDHKKLEDYIDTYEVLIKKNKAKDLIEQRILTIMANDQVEKIKTDSGHVYHAKYLKTKQGFALRRTKL